MLSLRRRHSIRSVRRNGCLSEPTLREALARRGYTTVALLGSEDLDALRSIRAAAGTAPGDDRSGLFNDTWASDLGWKQEVNRRLAEVLAPRLAERFPEHRPLGFAQIVKWPGDGGVVPAHRDPTFVSEHRFRSLMVWVPLDDVDREGGTLWVVPGTHRDRTGVRVHQSPANLVEGVRCDSSGRAVPVAVQAGQALVYDHAIVHLSGVNGGTEPRVVVASPLVPSGAAVRYSVATNDGVIDLAVDERFFVDHRLCDLDVDRVLEQYPVMDGPRRGRPSSRHRVAG